MLSNTIERISVGVVVTVCAFTVPWWLFLGAGLLLCFLYPVYIEFIIIAFVLDVAAGAVFFIVPFPWLTIAAFCAVVLSIVLRDKLRFYEESVDSLSL